ncbi:MAG: hypothetical protein WCI00_09655 [bacterium]
MMLHVSTPARSSLNWKTIGDIVGEILAPPAGDILLIVGACGALKENDGVHVWVCEFSLGLSVTEMFTLTCFSISYGAGEGKLTKYHLILLSRVYWLILLFPVRLVMFKLLGVSVYGQDHDTQVGQLRVTLIVPLFTHS